MFVGEDGALLRNPMAYRDPHTFERMEEYLNHVADRKTVYDITGIQFMNFNSLFQLYAMQQAGNSALKHCQKILFIPDALSWMLTGEAVCEYTIASTSQMLDPRTGDLSERLLKSVGLTREHFGRMVLPRAGDCRSRTRYGICCSCRTSQERAVCLPVKWYVEPDGY